MTHQVFDTPLNAEMVDGEVVITGPDGFNGSMTVEAARISLEHLRRALEAGGETDGPYPKPLG